MNFDLEEVPVSGVNWNLFIPREFLNDVGIREENLTFGMLLKMFSALREKSKEEGDVYHEEMRRGY